MNETQIAKIRRFLADKEMQETIKGVLTSKFLEKKNNSDVHILASQTLSVQFLEDAWREMERYKQEEKKPSEKSNVAV